MMYIVHCATQQKKAVVIKGVVPKDFAAITRARFAFDWDEVDKSCILYKLTIAGEDNILGLMAIRDHPDQQWIEIELLASSVENTGKQKTYERIAGCLIAFACREAVRKYTPVPLVSLIPKTLLKEHYIRKYGMLDGSKFVYLDEEPLLNILKEYYYDEG